ncbi:MAG: sensor histidine kinase [Rhodobacteraceae bacterium]|nr:sensor histidine kinase [Paracoccaceae bacterium]
MRDTTETIVRDGDVVLGEDWVGPESALSGELSEKRARRGWLALRRSPITRKIITFNLIALNVLVAGILYLNSSRDSLVDQRSEALVFQAELVADVIEANLPASAPANLATGDGIDIDAAISNLDLRKGLEVLVFDPSGTRVGQHMGQRAPDPAQSASEPRTILTDGLTWVWSRLSAFVPQTPVRETPDIDTQMQPLILESLSGLETIQETSVTESGSSIQVVTPVSQAGLAIGAVALVSPAGEIDKIVAHERERVLQMFVVATLVSVGLSLVLASTLANPLADLAEAAEIGRDRNVRNVNPGRVRIPDLTARPDEIGRLSGALRGMIAALYTRIDGNEQFAADVAHEIKNPLASLRSAVGTLRMVKKDEQRERLMDVIEHDVRRLDRLVSDISNASRLDSELVKEEEEPFDLLQMLRNLGQYLGEDAGTKGIEFITDLPEREIVVQGLEARLAQVFVNLITNAISFCEPGDAIRIWARKRENRVLVVVEDTGPGIPDEALTKIFRRFYSQRPEEHFGNNSGLGLAISKQIVEAHGGVIWAENIRPTDADMTSEPLGARFVVGLPV